MKLLLPLGMAAGLFFSAQSGFAQSEVATLASDVLCGSAEASGFDTVRYCYRSNSASNNMVVHFHGAGQNEESIFRTDKPDEIMSSITRSGLQMPTVLSISAGRLRWFSDRSSGDLNSLVNTIDSIIKKVKGTAPINTVVLYGVSMGGFNGLQVFTRKPEMFTRAIFSCPAWTDADPFSDSSWSNDPDTAAGKFFSRMGFRKTLQDEFQSSANWKAGNPFERLKAGLRRATTRMPVLVTTVSDDGFGFINTPVRGAELLRTMGFIVSHQKTEAATHCHPAPGPLVDMMAR